VQAQNLLSDSTLACSCMHASTYHSPHCSDLQISFSALWSYAACLDAHSSHDHISVSCKQLTGNQQILQCILIYYTVKLSVESPTWFTKQLLIVVAYKEYQHPDRM
jgi:hypothetical protein